MATRPKKVRSPTGKPSKVRKEIKDFDAGKKVAGKRPVVKAPPRKKIRGRSTAEKMDRGERLTKQRRKKR